MIIKYLGHSSFKIESKASNGSVIIVTDPFDSSFTGLSWEPLEANIVTVSHSHGDHNYVSGVGGDYFLVDSPGEYEVEGIHIYGVDSFHDKSAGKERGKNTIFLIETLEKIRVTHLGDLGTTLSSEQIDELSDTDILMVPVGGVYTINSKEAMEVVDQLEPRIVIPMHFRTDKHLDAFKDLATLEDFISESGLDAQFLNKLSLKSRQDLPEETQLIVLK